MKKYIRFDWAVKKLLRSKANFKILEGFLSELLEQDIKINKILESESNRDDESDKFNRVDMLVENQKKELIIIELQNSYEYDYFQRMLYGSSRLVTEYLNIGKPYSEIKKIYSIHIVYFDLGHGKDYIYIGRTQFIGKHYDDILLLDSRQEEFYNKKEICSLYPEYYLIKVNQFNDIAKDTLDEWIYFLKNEDIEPEFKAKGLKEASNKLNMMKLSYEERKVYDRYFDRIRDEASYYISTYKLPFMEGEKKGIRKGIKKGEKIGIEKGEKIGIEKGEKIGIEKGEKIGIEKGEKIGI
ncbi:MAG: hypothetical protein QG635_2487, partial [Bacteroidota bacterium]|nr:hypothetical protein [Bacteroidota bacterium]